MRIGVDGFNLAMRRGTGIATYARTLTHNLHAMGHEIDVVFGMNISDRVPRDVREILFFDNFDQDEQSRLPKPLTAAWFAARRGEWFGFDALHIPISGRVESRGFLQRMPAYERIFNVASLFQHAARYFKRTNRFLTIRIKNPPEIMHWTYPLPIRLAGARNIYTVHDLVPLRLPYTTLDNKNVHYRLIKRICEQADMVCTVSEASRQDIIAYFPKAAPKIFTTFQSLRLDTPPSLRLDTPPSLRLDTHQTLPLDGLARQPTRPEPAFGPDEMFGLQARGYFIFFGSLEPKKNIARLIEAYLAAPTSRKLVIVGAMAWKAEGELRHLRQLEANARIHHLEYLPEATLMRLVRNARAVLFPSLTEGFGLPVLEAMTLGTPVLTSREGALTEVAGDSAVYVDAYDIASITAGIVKLDTDDALCDGMQTKGYAQAERFSAVNYQNKLVEMYRSVLTNRQP